MSFWKPQVCSEKWGNYNLLCHQYPRLYIGSLLIHGVLLAVPVEVQFILYNTEGVILRQFLEVFWVFRKSLHLKRIGLSGLLSALIPLVWRNDGLRFRWRNGSHGHWFFRTAVFVIRRSEMVLDDGIFIRDADQFSVFLSSDRYCGPGIYKIHV